MGKTPSLHKKFYKMYKKKMAAPKLPNALRKKLIINGFNVPKAKNTKEFFDQLGIVSDPNKDAVIGFNDKLGNYRKEKKNNAKNKTEMPEAILNLPEALKSIPEPERGPYRLAECDFRMLNSLRKKYGDDYYLMSIDHRLNTFQLNETQLKKKFAVFDAEVQYLKKKFEGNDNEK